MANRESRLGGTSGTDFPLQKHWAAISVAHEKIGKFPESQIIAYLYDEVRTYFMKNPGAVFFLPAAEGGGQEKNKKNEPPRGQKMEGFLGRKFFARSQRRLESFFENEAR